MVRELGKITLARVTWATGVTIKLMVKVNIFGVQVTGM
jgi:hypothetical protein